MLKCCFNCGKLFRESAHGAKQRLRGAFVLPQTFLSQCLRPRCMLGLFMSLVVAAVRTPRARDRPQICRRLFPAVPEKQRPDKESHSAAGGNNALRQRRYKTDPCCLKQPSSSQRLLTHKQFLFQFSSFLFVTPSASVFPPRVHSLTSSSPNISNYINLPAGVLTAPPRWKISHPGIDSEAASHDPTRALFDYILQLRPDVRHRSLLWKTKREI